MPQPLWPPLEDRLSDFGFDVVPTAETAGKLSSRGKHLSLHFSNAGGLGLLLGTLGMAAILLRNVLERRRELALMRAVGYDSSHFTLMIIAENAFLLCCGLVTGTVCALLAIAPVFFSRQAHVGSFSLGLLLLAVLISGLTASIWRRGPLCGRPCCRRCARNREVRGLAARCAEGLALPLILRLLWAQPKRLDSRA